MFGDALRRVADKAHAALREVEASLKRLQTDHVDLLHVHSVGKEDDLAQIEAKDGVTWAFQHNGSLNKESQDKDVIDSQILFHLVLEALEGRDHAAVAKATKAARQRAIDEYGGLQGVLTIADVVEEIIGGELLSAETPEPRAVQRDDGSWLLDGMMLLDEVQMLLDLDELPGEAENYDTVGGLFMAQLGRIPVVGDWFQWQSLRFEVVDMDGHRVDKVLVMPTKPAPQPNQS